MGLCSTSDFRQLDPKAGRQKTTLLGLTGVFAIAPLMEHPDSGRLLSERPQSCGHDLDRRRAAQDRALVAEMLGQELRQACAIAGPQRVQDRGMLLDGVPP